MLYQRIMKEKLRLDDEINHIRSKLATMPKENLILAKNGEKYRKWYCSDGKQIKYIPKRERKEFTELICKKFLLVRLKALLQEQKAIDSYLKYHKEDSYLEEQELLQSSGFQEFISNIFQPKEKRFQEWMNAPYKKNTFHPENLIHKTRSGIYVRSKSEVLIARILSEQHIPFRYECALQLDERCIYPDFTILHPVTGEVFYWEHFGLMDDASYSQNAFSKMQLYNMNGIIPSVNLITTYETEKHPLSEEMIEKIVEYYFL